MTNPQSTAKIAGHPIHPMLIPFPVAFLVTAFLCDFAYWYSANPLFATGALWLLGAAIVTALLAALMGFIDFFGDERIRALNDAWYHMIGNLVAVVIATINFYVRYTSEDISAPILSSGIWLSLVTVLLLLFNGWKGWEMVYKHRVAVSDDRVQR